MVSLTMIFDMQTWITWALASCVFVTLGAVLVDHLCLYTKLNKLRIPMEQVYTRVPFYLLSRYYTHKNEIDPNEISEEFIKRFLRNMRFALIAVVINLVWLWFYLMNKAMNL